jgi:ribosomal protein S18 acetylase RimI-like enzyme
MPDIKTRPVCTADLPDLFTMVQALASHHGDTANLTMDALARDVLDASWMVVIVATCDDVLGGYAALTPMAQLQFGVRGYDMHHLFVKRDLRGQGLGRMLLDACVTHAKAHHCRFVTVGTHPNNTAAQEFYKSAGFAQRPLSGPRFSAKW